MTRKNFIILGIIVAIFAFSLWVLIPPDSNRIGRDGMRLGLDLVGGVHLVYQADFTEDMDDSDRAAAMERTLITIQNRIDKYGVTEPVIQQMDDDRIMVQLPGFTDIEAAKELVEQTGFLEFREVELDTSGNPVYLSDYLEQEDLSFIDSDEEGTRFFTITYVTAEEDYEYRTVAVLTRQNDGSYELTDSAGEPVDAESLADFTQAIAWIPARGGSEDKQLTGDLLSDAQPLQDTSSIVTEYVVHIEWNDEGSVIFDDIAARLYGTGSVKSRIGIFLDGTMLSAPTINVQSYGGSGQIEGGFTAVEVEQLANLLKSGSLPIPLEKPPLFQEKVSATLGANFIEMSVIAGIIGLALIMLFMIAYYRVPGALASLALLFYAAVILTIFKLWPVTLSLASFGGFIVSLGMAVDANVLIFERFKEELRKGRTVSAAVEEGFNRAWTAILDSNVTTVIACIILIWLASSVISSAQVMGFAVTLLIGVIVSMFTAIVITRTLLRMFVSTGLGRKTRLYLMDWGKK